MNTLFTISLVIEFFFGLGFILMPATMVGFFGESLTGLGSSLPDCSDRLYLDMLS